MIFGRKINKYYFKYGIFFLLGIAALIFVDIYQLKLPEIIAIIVDGIDYNTLTKEVLFDAMNELLIIVAIMFTGRFVWRVTIFGNGVRIETDIRDEMFSHALKMPQRFYSENKVGEVMALFTNDLQTLRMSFAMGTMMLVDVFALGVMSFVKMWKIDWLLTLFSTIPLLIIAIMGRIIGKYMSKKFTERQKAYAELTDFTQESYSGIGVVRAFVKEAKELLAFNKINQKNMDKNVEFVKAAMLLQVLITLLIGTILTIIIGYGSYLVYLSSIGEAARANLSIGDLVKYISFFSTLVWPMMAIAQLINLSSQAKASLKRVNKFFDEDQEIFDGTHSLDEAIKGEVVFDNLDFHYPGKETNVLSNISFKINAGENIGIIGRTGSGKTTLVDLLLRLYNIERDKVFVDGVDLMDYKVSDLRDNIAYVPQDNFLFSDTIANNISFSSTILDMDIVKDMAQLADIDENIIEFQDGYETILGERGVTVSGGQKQRISIARALFKHAPILILDDSVSAVDVNTEEKIINNLKKTRKNKTTILIAHRVSTVKHMDKILLLDEGRVVGFGKYKELLENNLEFKKMVELQQLEEEVGGVINE